MSFDIDKFEESIRKEHNNCVDTFNRFFSGRQYGSDAVKASVLHSEINVYKKILEAIREAKQ